jgi:hypothetical protein
MLRDLVGAASVIALVAGCSCDAPNERPDALAMEPFDGGPPDLGMQPDTGLPPRPVDGGPRDAWLGWPDIGPPQAPVIGAQSWEMQVAFPSETLALTIRFDARGTGGPTRAVAGSGGRASTLDLEIREGGRVLFSRSSLAMGGTPIERGCPADGVRLRSAVVRVRR